MLLIVQGKDKFVVSYILSLILHIGVTYYV